MNNVFFLLDLQLILNERVIEFIFNKKSKQELCENGALKIQQNFTTLTTGVSTISLSMIKEMLS